MEYDVDGRKNTQKAEPNFLKNFEPNLLELKFPNVQGMVVGCCSLKLLAHSCRQKITVKKVPITDTAIFQAFITPVLRGRTCQASLQGLR